MRVSLILSFLIACAALSINANAQNSSLPSSAIKGTVLDNYGKPLQGAEVKIKGSVQSVFSAQDGSFEIDASAGTTLVISSNNYYPDEIKVTNGKNLAVRLTPSYLKTADTVDVLYSVQSSNSVLGSVSTIYSSQLTSTPAPLYAYALAGRLPGLYTRQVSGFTNPSTQGIIDNNQLGAFAASSGYGAGAPNDNNEISLSLRGQAPVTIVDGIQRDIYTLDPDNIESVSVLKDGLSTLLLGQHSSRGVILITTKKPVLGAPHVSLNAQTGIQTPLGLPRPLPAYQFAYLYNEGLLNQGINNLQYTAADIQAYRDHSDPYGHPDINWYDLLLKDQAAINRVNLGISGGSAIARYSIGLSYFNQEGLFNSQNPDYNTNNQIQRYTINTNIDVNVTKDFTASLQLYARIQDGNQPGTGSDGLLNAMYTTPNNAYPVFNPDGSLGGSQAYNANLYGMLNQSGYLEDYTRDITSNLVVRYKFDKWIKGLSFRAQSNISVYTSASTNRSAKPSTFGFKVGLNGDTTYTGYQTFVAQFNGFSYTNTSQFWYLQTALDYANSFGKSNVTAKLFYDRNQQIFNYDLPKTNQDIAFNGGYNYAGKYFLEATLNYAGCDRYPPDHQWGWFYGAGLGWDAAQESFIKDGGLKWIEKLKIRGTYGRTGNDNVGYFTWRDSYSNNNFGGGTYQVYFIGTGRTNVAGSDQLVLANPNVTWEKGDKFNVGLDLAFLHNTLQITGEYYNNRYSDLLQTRGKQSRIIGISYPLENIGINRLTGFEFSATYQNHIKDFNFFLTGNLSVQQSKVIYMDEVDQPYPWLRRTGLPVGMPFGYIADGFITTQAEADTSATVGGYNLLQPGDVKLRDLNGDGIITPESDVAPIGTTKPLIFYGLTAGFSFKNFDVSFLLQGVGNRKIVLQNTSFGSGAQQSFEYLLGRWTPETANQATFPRVTSGALNGNNEPNWYYGGGINSLYVHSGNYFRLKNAEIGYTLPYNISRKIKINSLRFFVNGLNLFTYAEFERIDPEVYGGTGDGVYPNQRVINFGVNVKF